MFSIHNEIITDITLPEEKREKPNTTEILDCTNVGIQIINTTKYSCKSYEDYLKIVNIGLDHNSKLD